MEFENIREALECLVEINDSNLNPAGKIVVTDDNGIHLEKASYKNLQDFNTEALVYIADELGMSELYLNFPLDHDIAPHGREYHNSNGDEDTNQVIRDNKKVGPRGEAAKTEFDAHLDDFFKAVEKMLRQQFSKKEDKNYDN